MEHKNHSGRWEAIFRNWKLFSPPARPDEEICRIVTKAADEVLRKSASRGREEKRGEAPAVLILGSTPEYRDVAYRFCLLYGAETMCVDMSADNYRAMTEFMKHTNPKEHFLGENWLHVSYTHQFDVVLSDAAISNVPLGHRGEFYEIIRKALKKDGRFITREDVLTKQLEERREQKLEGLLEEYAQKVVDADLQLIPAMNVVGELWLRISAMNRRYAAEFAHFSEEAANLSVRLRLGSTPQIKIMTEMLSLLRRTYFADSEKYWIMMPEAEFETEARQHFDVQEKIVPPNCLLGDSLPVYVLSPRETLT